MVEVANFQRRYSQKLMRGWLALSEELLLLMYGLQHETAEICSLGEQRVKRSGSGQKKANGYHEHILRRLAAYKKSLDAADRRAVGESGEKSGRVFQKEQ